jgi:hypothetical protein
MSQADHYALLVGIGQYPHAGYNDLQGPANDVALIREWLVDPDGGDVDPANIIAMVSPDPKKNPAPTDYPPTDKEVWAALKAIVFDANGPILRPQGRLYLFFSGHGFSNFSELLNHAAMYTANADKHQPCHVCGTKMAIWCTQAAVFGEIVLIMDCCRDQEISKNAEPAPFLAYHHADAKYVKRFEVYAVPYNGKAQERMIKRKGKTYGVLTYALESALRSAPLVAQPGQGQVRNAHAVKSFIEGTWGSIIGVERIEAPSFMLPSSSDIVLTKSAPAPIRRPISFSAPLASQADLEVFGDDANTVVKRALLTPATNQITWYAPNAQPPEPFDGTVVMLELPPAIYEVVLKRPGAADVSASVSMMGDDDVVLAV